MECGGPRTGIHRAPALPVKTAMHAYDLIFWFLGAIAFTLARLAWDEWRQHVRYGSKGRRDDAAPHPTTAQLSG
jgi:hypothetical protein